MTLAPQMSITISGEGTFTAKKVALELGESKYRTFFLNLKEPMPLDRLLASKTWVECKGLIAADLIRVRMPTLHGGPPYDFLLVVRERVGTTTVIDPWPNSPMMIPKAAPALAHG